jgi:hypothetical protein
LLFLNDLIHLLLKAFKILLNLYFFKVLLYLFIIL